jgi:hypothetical protein
MTSRKVVVGFESIASVLRCSRHFRYYSDGGGKADNAALRIWANAQSRWAPARCAGARAERPVVVERTAIAG